MVRRRFRKRGSMCIFELGLPRCEAFSRLGLESSNLAPKLGIGGVTIARALRFERVGEGGAEGREGLLVALLARRTFIF